MQMKEFLHNSFQPGHRYPVSYMTSQCQGTAMKKKTIDGYIAIYRHNKKEKADKIFWFQQFQYMVYVHFLLHPLPVCLRAYLWRKTSLFKVWLIPTKTRTGWEGHENFDFCMGIAQVRFVWFFFLPRTGPLFTYIGQIYHQFYKSKQFLLGYLQWLVISVSLTLFGMDLGSRIKQAFSFLLRPEGHLKSGVSASFCRDSFVLKSRVFSIYFP